MTRSGSAGGCAAGLASGVQTCSAFVSITVSSAANPAYCLGSLGTYTACRAYVVCDGSGSSNLSGFVHLACGGNSSSSSCVLGLTGGTCSPSQRAGYSFFIATGNCVSLSGTTTTVNSIGSAPATRSVLVCVDPWGPYYF